MRAVEIDDAAHRHRAARQPGAGAARRGRGRRGVGARLARWPPPRRWSRGRPPPAAARGRRSARRTRRRTGPPASDQRAFGRQQPRSSASSAAAIGGGGVDGARAPRPGRSRAGEGGLVARCFMEAGRRSGDAASVLSIAVWPRRMRDGLATGSTRRHRASAAGQLDLAPGSCGQTRRSATKPHDHREPQGAQPGDEGGRRGHPPAGCPCPAWSAAPACPPRSHPARPAGKTARRRWSSSHR